MIIAADRKLEIGSVHRGRVTDANLEYCDVAFVVLRETDEGEYRRYADEHAPDADNPPFVAPHWFYAVAMD